MNEFPKFYKYIGDGEGNGDVIKVTSLHEGIIVKSNYPSLVDEYVDIYDYDDWVELSNRDMIIEGLSYMYDLNHFAKKEETNRGDGGSTSYYILPANAQELGDLIHYKSMSHSIGEAFCALYRLNDNGERKRNLRKAQYYIEQELQRMD